MRRNCNLELRLFPTAAAGSHHDESDRSPLQSHQQSPQPLTIFYDGKICVCDVTEFQARSILMMANKEMEGRGRSSEPCSPMLMQSSSASPLGSPAGTTNLSMKRSLQRFLQKRKNRIQEASPYTITTKTYMS